jgi:translation elongation factor EF-Tu-like GTPase
VTPPQSDARTVRARIRLRPTSDGGRKAPIGLDGRYRPHVVVVGGDGTHLGVIVRSSEATEVDPGETSEVTLQLLYDIDYSSLSAGAAFTIVEGPKAIGDGQVL